MKLGRVGFAFLIKLVPQWRTWHFKLLKLFFQFLWDLEIDLSGLFDKRFRPKPFWKILKFEGAVDQILAFQILVREG